MADEKGNVNKVRSVRRIPEGERWGQDNRRWVKRVPWNKSQDDEGADGHLPEDNVVDVDEPKEEKKRDIGEEAYNVTVRMSKKPRDFYIT